MKKFLFCSVLFVSTYVGFSQDAVVSNAKLNVLYIGIANPIEVSMPNVPANKLKVSVDNNAEIRKMADGKYNVFVSVLGETNIYVEANGVKTAKLFRVKRTPDPIAVLEGVEGGYLSVNVLKTAKGIQAVLPHFDFDAKCVIQSYEIKITPKQGESFQMQVSGGDFPEALKAKFDKLDEGTSVNITHVKARCPGDVAARVLSGINFVLR
jgi:GldM C-terminal domain